MMLQIKKEPGYPGSFFICHRCQVARSCQKQNSPLLYAYTVFGNASHDHFPARARSIAPLTLASLPAGPRDHAVRRNRPFHLVDATARWRLADRHLDRAAAAATRNRRTSAARPGAGRGRQPARCPVGAAASAPSLGIGGARPGPRKRDLAAQRPHCRHALCKN